MKPPLYIHIPYCLQKCGYCDFFSRPQKEVPSEYEKALENQIKYLAKAFCVEEWKSLYIGGGTPSLLLPEDLKSLCRSLKAAAPLAHDCEWTIEMNPGSISREALLAAKENGINRLSLGIQCCNEKVLDAIGRKTSFKEIQEALFLAKDFWQGSWSADLIAGLPFQTKKDLERDIKLALDFGANHISLYSLTLEEGTPLKKKIDEKKIPYDEEEAEALWLYGRDLLEQKGFEQYEVSNFSKPGFESRHNSFYWSQENYLGAGAGAAGTIYGMPTGFRYTNVLDSAKYIKYWSEEKKASQGQDVRAALNFPCQIEELDFDTEEFEFLMLALRTKRGASAAEYKARYGKDLAARLGLKGRPEGKKGGALAWLEKNERGGDAFYTMTREGLLFLNSFLEEL